MSAADFTSGPWTGFFTYTHISGRWRTDLILSFECGRMTGEGNDSIGPFVIAGAYDDATKECYWTKTYVGAHDVFYKGFREGKGIWGTWEIQEVWRGGFQIWPLGSEDGQNEVERAEEVRAADRVFLPEKQKEDRSPVRADSACGCTL